MNHSPSYVLTLHKSYYDNGFFNLGVAVSRFVRHDNGPITIRLGKSGPELTARVDRNANQNLTPRIFGGSELRNWIQRNCSELEQVNVIVLAPDVLQIVQIDGQS